MDRCIQAGQLLMPDGFRENQTLAVRDGRVAAIHPGTGGELSADYVVPGLIDPHLHGGFGFSVMCPSPEGMAEWLMMLLRGGVTHVLAGVHTAPVPEMRAALGMVRQTMELQRRGEMGGARLLGVHLEGPFISLGAPGAMDPECILAPSVESYQSLTEGYEPLILEITLAPEMDGSGALIDYLKARGVKILAGHTTASCEQGEAAFARGVGGICHTFNASTPIRHREPGILTAALLNDGIYCECICDMVHVHPAAVQLIYRMKGARRMIAISDAVSTTGLPDGRYEDGGSTVIVKNGVSRIEAGNLCGGAANLLRGARNLIGLGIPVEHAFRMASRTAAEWLKLNLGAIEPGAEAALVGLNAHFDPLWVVLGNQLEAGGE